MLLVAINFLYLFSNKVYFNIPRMQLVTADEKVEQTKEL